LWLIWAGFFLPSWTALFIVWPGSTAAILWISALTAPFGLIEPIFISNQFKYKWEMKK
jgi:hypothetical protein